MVVLTNGGLRRGLGHRPSAIRGWIGGLFVVGGRWCTAHQRRDGLVRIRSVEILPLVENPDDLDIPGAVAKEEHVRRDREAADSFPEFRACPPDLAWRLRK